MADVPTLVGAAVNDVLSLFQLAGVNVTGAVVQTAVSAYLKRRTEDARDILLQEFANARVSSLDIASEDDLGGILFRYFNAIRDNAGRLNLRLMAKVMVGQAERDQLFADDFTRYANVLSSLSRDEIVAIALLHTVMKSVTPPSNNEEVWTRLIELAVPTHFATEDYVHAVITGASRSGLVVMPRDIFAVGSYVTSPLMDEISQLADFKDALRREGIVD